MAGPLGRSPRQCSGRCRCPQTCRALCHPAACALTGGGSDRDQRPGPRRYFPSRRWHPSEIERWLARRRLPQLREKQAGHSLAAFSGLPRFVSTSPVVKVGPESSRGCATSGSQSCTRLEAWRELADEQKRWLGRAAVTGEGRFLTAAAVACRFGSTNAVALMPWRTAESPCCGGTGGTRYHLGHRAERPARQDWAAVVPACSPRLGPPADLAALGTGMDATAADQPCLRVKGPWHVEPAPEGWVAVRPHHLPASNQDFSLAERKQFLQGNHPRAKQANLAPSIDFGHSFGDSCSKKTSRHPAMSTDALGVYPSILARTG